MCERNPSCAAFAWTPNDFSLNSCRAEIAGQTPRLERTGYSNDHKFEYCTPKGLLGGSRSKGSGGGKGSGDGSSGSKSDNLDLSGLFGGSKSQSTFGEWATTSDKQECRSECRPKSAGSY